MNDQPSTPEQAAAPDPTKGFGIVSPAEAIENAAIIAKILETITRYKESVAGEVSDAAKSARLRAVAEVVWALAYGNEDNIRRAPGEAIVRGLGGTRGMIGELFFEPRPRSREPFKVTAEILPVVEAMFSIGLPHPGWDGVEAEIVVRESFR
jgi:hypothetical protein